MLHALVAVRPAFFVAIPACCTWGVQNLLKAANQPSKRKAALLGVGLDAPDEHKRLTRGKNFLLVGGSQETHAKMQETAIKLNEKLDQRGKRLEDVSVRELRDIFHEIEK